MNDFKIPNISTSYPWCQGLSQNSKRHKQPQYEPILLAKRKQALDPHGDFDIHQFETMNKLKTLKIRDIEKALDQPMREERP